VNWRWLTTRKTVQSLRDAFVNTIHVRSTAIEAAVAPAFVERGRVVAIGLDVVRARIGDRWEKSRETIIGRLEAILRHRLGPADFFLELTDTSYCVVMPGSDPLDAQVCCLRVAYELHSSLFGPCDVDCIRLARATSLENGALTLEPILHARIRDLTIRAGLQDLLRSAPQDQQEVVPLSGPRTNAGPAKDEYSINFVPLWDARREAITTWRCRARKTLPGAPGLGGITKLKDDLTRTLALLHRASAVLADRIEKGDRFLIDVPLPYDMLSAPLGRMEFGAACRELPADYRAFLTFEISDMPPGVPHSRVNELVTAIKPFCKAVFAQVPYKEGSYTPFQAAGINAIGMAIPRYGRTTSELREEIYRLASATRKMAVLSYLLDVDRLDLLGMACDAGIGFIAGSVIGTAQAMPSHMSRLSRAQVEGDGKNVVAL
jgi:hypothetical protein